MSIIEIRVAGKYKLRGKVGNGAFGEIFRAQNVQTNEEVAVKLEEIKCKYPQLIYEAKILHCLQGGTGIPQLLWCGQDADYNVLIMELLGDNLETLLQRCSGKLSLKTVLMLADQSIHLLEYMHNKGFLHRDLKPENLLMGQGKKGHIVHIIDYGLSKRYRDPRTGQHIPYREGKQLTGTARYASVNTHLGIEQSRRDDIESLGYVLVYLLKGNLPWQGLVAKNKKEKYTKILEKKKGTAIQALCKGIPDEFRKYFEYCKRLSFDEKPDYHYLRRLFKERFMKEGLEFDYVFDWLLIPTGIKYNVHVDKICTNIEFDANEEFTNNNIQQVMKLKLPKKEKNMGVFESDDEDEDEEQDQVDNLQTLATNKKNPGTERLRTELQEEGYVPNHPPKGRGGQFRTEQDSQLKEKPNKKDCNIF